MRLLYLVTKGMDDPTLASVAPHIAANGSIDIGQEVSVGLAGDLPTWRSKTTCSAWRAWAYPHQRTAR